MFGHRVVLLEAVVWWVWLLVAVLRFVFEHFGEGDLKVALLARLFWEYFGTSFWRCDAARTLAVLARRGGWVLRVVQLCFGWILR